MRRGVWETSKDSNYGYLVTFGTYSHWQIDFRRPEILLRSPSFALADSSPWEPTTVPLFNTLWRSPLVLVIFKHFNI